MNPRGARLRKAVRWLCIALAISGIIYLLLPRPDLYPANLSYSRAVLDRAGHVVHLTLTSDGKYRLHTPLSAVSPELRRATLLLEDQHFASHLGVNPVSMLRATWGAITGAKLGGGSTITMQYARVRWQLKTTGLVGKAMQMMRAVQLERHYSKDGILEAYFNLAPYGGNVEGAGAASLLWCDKACADLNLREAVALAVLPQSPTKRRPQLGRENTAHQVAMRRLWARSGETRDPLDDGYALRPEASAPREIPHLARRLLNERPKETLIRTDIELSQQHTLERTLSDFLEQLRAVGITNGCALLVHVPTRQVRGYVGSAAFLDASIHGQVDGITARRSPGSSLKPFVYALAMQQGLIHPRSLVRDGKLDYADYNPENFDREFTGPITAADALFRSRNIPAITLAEKLAAPGLHGFLKANGVKLPKGADHYGLSLPLGGAEVSMEELVHLYADLASGTAKVKPEVCFLTREMMRGPEHGSIAFKTGTSHGFRDAWCTGIIGEYVLSVWLGNFDGRGNPSLVARTRALPLLQQIAERLSLPLAKDATPPGVRRVDLCAVSGDLPAKCCEHRAGGWFLPGVSPIKTCTLHREVWVDVATGLRVRANDSTRPARREVHEFWPPDMLALYRQAGLPRKAPPAWSEGLAMTETDVPPRIVSPLSKRIYSMHAADPGKQAIPLRVEAAAGVAQVFWFAGTEFLGSCKPAETLLWKARAGTWKLQALDDHGRSSECAVVVEGQ